MDNILADCELSSSYSSTSSEHMRTYCEREIFERPYDTLLHLENVRSSTIAERKKPVLITYPKASINDEIIALLQSKSINKTFIRSRYEARRKFFEDCYKNLPSLNNKPRDFEHEKNVMEKDTLSKTKMTNVNHGNEISKQNTIVKLANEKLPLYSVEIYDTHLVNSNLKTHIIEKLNGGKQYLSNFVAHPVRWQNSVQPSLVELIDISTNNYRLKETKPDYSMILDKAVSVCKEIKNDNITNFELKKQNIQSWIETCMYDNNFPNKEDGNYDSYCDNITKIIESVNMNITSSRTELDALPNNSDTCVKYSLDSTNMSLIYSLTPPAVVDQEENGNDDTLRNTADGCCDPSEWQLDSMKNNSDTICIKEPIIKIDVKPVDNSVSQDCMSIRDSISSESSYEQSENRSTNGSDLLELPRCTVLELKDIDGEIFHNGINESANEIIADLNASSETLPYDAIEIAQYVISEIIECVYILSYLDSSIYDLSVIREIVRHLIDSYHYECLLIESPNRAYISNIKTKDDDNVCRIKSFLEHTSPNLPRDDATEVCERGGDESSAVIQFCTVAKKLPFFISDDRGLELNFHVTKIPMDENANISCQMTDELKNLSDNVVNNNRIDKNILKTKNEENVTMARQKNQELPCDQYFCCREEEESLQNNYRLTPISEESDEIPSTTSVIGDFNDELKSRSINLNSIEEEEEEGIRNSARECISLDDTYTIIEVSDNENWNNHQEQYDICNSSIDCMSYSYDTKEFIRLEKAVADDSQLNA